MRVRILLTAVALVVFCGAALAQDYGQLMATKVQAVLGKRAVKGYTFSTYPLDNFGLATAYSSDVNDTNVDCATWDCLGISDSSQVDSMSDDQKLRLVAGGVQYAEVGCGADLNLTEEEKRSLGLSAILPKILQAVGLSASISHSNDITTILSVGPICRRILRRQDMLNRLSARNGQSLEEGDFDSGNLVLIYADIVMKSMHIEIKVNPQTNADIEAKLNGTLGGNVGKVIGSGSSLSFKVNNATSGDYTLTITKPLVLAVYAKKQPEPRRLGIGNGWNDWPNFDLGNRNKVLEQTVLIGSN
jgi:hypothetical protein